MYETHPQSAEVVLLYPLHDKKKVTARFSEKLIQAIFTPGKG